MGGYCAAEVTGAKAIMSTIPELTRRHACGMCGTFHFVPLGHHFTDSR
jgi:hypothetical protein